MKDPSCVKKICPHCGKPAKRSPGISFYILIPALIGAVFFLLASGGADVETAPPEGGLSADVAAYIGSRGADEACGVCLAAAGNFLESKRLAALREKTKDMAAIGAGEYQSGSPDGAGDPDEHPMRQVRLDAFYIDKKEVTTEDYLKFARETGANYPEWAKPGGKFNVDTGAEPHYKRLAALLKTCADCPITGVTVRDAEAYCGEKGRRLPTEAEWEAAARGGAASAFSFGENSARAGDYAWYDVNSGERPNPVGRKNPNKYGLYDMHGNVWEWVSDRYDRGYYAVSPRLDPGGPAAGTENVIRGGSWAFDTDSMRSANRASTYKANDDIGFRCAVSERSLVVE